MSKYFLVPDIHGEFDMAAGLLQQEGLMSEDGERLNDDVITVQMGDYLNCVVSSIADDARCLNHEYLFDVLLIGNHEHPYFGGPAFNGFWNDPALSHKVHLMDFESRYSAALNCDGVLVTHAGVTPDLYSTLNEEGIYSPSQVAWYLNDLWRKDKSAHPFSSISWNRGGPYKTGGILWADWKEYKTSKLKQVVGHSVAEYVRVQTKGRQLPVDWVDLRELTGFSWKNDGPWEAICLDLGAGKHSDTIAGAWIEDGNVRLVSWEKE